MFPRRAPRIITRKRSALRIVYFEVEVKIWAEKLPSVGAVRPERCPCCGQAGAGGRLGLVGHGLRERQVVGPQGASDPPEQVVLLVRRYRCRNCGAIVMSMPRGVLRRALYGAVAVGMALALWAQGESSAGVRRQVSPWHSSGSERFHGWRSLRRWAARAAELWCGLRLDAARPLGRARQLVSQLAARAVSAAGNVVELVAEGALR